MRNITDFFKTLLAFSVNESTEEKLLDETLTKWDLSHKEFDELRRRLPILYSNWMEVIELHAALNPWLNEALSRVLKDRRQLSVVQREMRDVWEGRYRRYDELVQVVITQVATRPADLMKNERQDIKRRWDQLKAKVR